MFYDVSSGTVATIVVAMTRGSKTRSGMRAASRRPTHAHVSATGASRAISGRCSRRSRPMPIVKGALMTFTVKKKYLVVSKDSLTEECEA